jgi:hypothetical protein
MVFNATFNKISVLLVEETGENHRPLASHWQTIENILHWARFELATSLIAYDDSPEFAFVLADK